MFVKGLWDVSLNGDLIEISLRHLMQAGKYRFWILKIILDRHSLFGQTTKQPLGNFEPQKTWKYQELWVLRSDPNCLQKNVAQHMRLL